MIRQQSSLLDIVITIITIITMTVNSSTLGRSALITYGSETGNAQDFADELSRLTERLRFVTRVCPLDAVELVCTIQTSASTRGQC